MILREIFPNAIFYEPKITLIPVIEEELGLQIPTQLKNLYAETDGFREDIGNAKYLFSLKEEDSIGSLLSITKYFHEAAILPKAEGFLFFGSSSGGEYWGINAKDQTTIIEYHHSMGNTYEKIQGNIIELYKQDYDLYNL